MNKSEYGFSALEKRFLYLGGTNPVAHAEERRFDLDELISHAHGSGYVANPRLPTLIALNGITTRYSHSGQEQAKMFDDGAHGDLARCTSERARNIAQLAQLFVSGRLQTARSGPAVTFAGKHVDSVETVLAIGSKLREAGHELAQRHGGRPSLVLSDEYDYQDLLRALLRLFFEDVRAEDATPQVAGATARVDFVLPDVGIAVELKVTRPTLKAKDLGEELIIDARRYESHKDARQLICLVFDHGAYLSNPGGLERDLSVVRGGVPVTVRIYR